MRPDRGPGGDRRARKPSSESIPSPWGCWPRRPATAPTRGGHHPAAGGAPQRGGRRWRVHRQPGRGTLRVPVPDAAGQPANVRPAERGFGIPLFAQTSYGPRGGQRLDRQLGLPVGHRQCRVHGLALGPAGFAEIGGTPSCVAAPTPPGKSRASRAYRCAGAGSSRNSWPTSTPRDAPLPRSTRGCGSEGSSAGTTSARTSPRSGQAALYCVTELHTQRRHRPAGRPLAEVTHDTHDSLRTPTPPRAGPTLVTTRAASCAAITPPAGMSRPSWSWAPGAARRAHPACRPRSPPGPARLPR